MMPLKGNGGTFISFPLAGKSGSPRMVKKVVVVFI
jgi:hypothetical protein